MENNLLSVSHIAEILYCPRNFYYRVIESANETNHYMEKGKWEDEKREERLKDYKNDRIIRRKVNISSENIGITAVLDIVEDNKGVIYPVEIKSGQKQNNINDDVQLCAQAMLLEENKNIKINYGYIYYHGSRQRRKVNFTPELRELVIKTIMQAWEIIENRTIPEPINDNRCNGCSLIERCLPSEIQYILSQQENTLRKKLVRPTPSVNLGRILYVDEAGAYIKKESEHFIITKNKEKIKEVPTNMIDEMVLVGNVNWSSGILQLGLKKEIPVSILDNMGNFIGRFQPVESKNSLLRTAQYETFFNQNERHNLAKQFVLGKSKNMKTLLQRYNRIKRDEQIDEIIIKLKNGLVKIQQAKDNNELLGIEGYLSKLYFDGLSLLIKEPFIFSNRNRRPPKDPVNSMLGLGYTLLMKSILASIQTVGLDPYLGFYHVQKYNRPALALDMMEEFRSIIVDSLILTLINKNMIKPDDFETIDETVILTDSARKTFFKAFENRLNEKITHPIFGYRVSYRRIIELQVRFLAKVLQKEIPEYTSFIVR